MVGIVVTISPNFSLYKIVVLPAASSPTINILISFLPKRPLNKFENIFPILLAICYNLERRKPIIIAREYSDIIEIFVGIRTTLQENH